jgi:hypothetical protein
LEQTSGRSILERNLVIEVHETYFEKSKRKDDPPVQMERFIARSKLTILDCIKYAKTGIYMLYLQDDKKRVKGKLYLSNFSIKSHYSFMDLYI